MIKNTLTLLGLMALLACGACVATCAQRQMSLEQFRREHPDIVHRAMWAVHATPSPSHLGYVEVRP